MGATFIPTLLRPAFPTLRVLPLHYLRNKTRLCRNFTQADYDAQPWNRVRSTRTLCKMTTEIDSTFSHANLQSVINSTIAVNPTTSPSDDDDPTSMFATKTFRDLGLSEATEERLKKCGLLTPTKAQAAVIPALLKGLELQSSYAAQVRSALEEVYDALAEKEGKPSLETQVELGTNYKAGPKPESDIDDVLMFAAETGSGKTLAYLAPFIEVAERTADVPLKAIILLPTRELCSQVSSFIHTYFDATGEQTSSNSVGRESTSVDEGLLNTQKNLLPCARHVILSGGEVPYSSYNKNDVRIVLATPAALLQHLRMSDKVTSMSDKLIIVDEADMLLQGAFLKDVDRVLNQLGMKPFATRKNGHVLSRNANRLVFVGATFPHWVGTKVRSIVTWMKQRYPNMRAIQTPSVHRRSTRLNSRWYHLPSENDRFKMLQEVLLSSPPLYSDSKPSNGDDEAPEKVMVFCGKADTAVRVAQFLETVDLVLSKYNGVVELHKLVPAPQRKLNLKSFVEGDACILVCTDLASRGLHLGHVDRIIEFDFASNVVTYLHRIGRTARAGATGATDHFYDDVSKPLAEAIREKAETEATVVESIFSRNRSFRRKLKRRKQQESEVHRLNSVSNSETVQSKSVSMEDVEIDKMDDAERERWNT